MSAIALVVCCLALASEGLVSGADVVMAMSQGLWSNSKVDPPKWSRTYIVSGVLQLPYAEIKEPFYAYYDGDANMSRIDYYGDMVKTVQRGDVKYGQSYKVAPMTTETVTNVKTCFLVNGTVNSSMGIQSVLPDLTQFAKISDDSPCNDNKHCQVWQNVTIVGRKKNTYTMYLQMSNGTATPVRYEMIGFDSLIGSHYDRYYIDYSNYQIKKPKKTVFTDPFQKIHCGGFPGPGNYKHHVMNNPMREYIHSDDRHVHPMFEEFKSTHKRTYKSHKEHETRKNYFRHNTRFVHSTNRANLGYRVKLNHIADWSDSERQMLNGYRKTKGHHGGLPFLKAKYTGRDLPDQIDWRLYGAVTPVKDQAVCGSCWSFGTTGTVEGKLFLTKGHQVRLSQQALMDCSWGEGNNACDGGEDFRSYQWIMKHGLPTEESYGLYLGQDGYCHFKNATIGASITGYVNVTPGDQQALKMAIAHEGPVSVAIDASHRSFSFYSDGVYYDPACGNTEDDLDHAVLAVGYGVMNGQAYWLVKNSWSTNWGNVGYVLMSWKDNNCGVATSPTFVNM